MELSLLTMVIVGVVVVWYFGSLLNKLVVKAEHILDNSAEMATDEFDYLRSEQKVRLAKQYNGLGTQVENMDLKHSKTSVQDMLNKIGTADVK